MLKTLLHLRDLGHSVLVVEHDEGTMRAADCIVDIGPGAGEHGGQIVAVGTAEEIDVYKRQVCSPDYPFKKKPKRIEDLFGERILIREDGSGTREVLELSLIHISNFFDPAVTMKIVDGIESYMKQHGFESVADMVGIVK